MRSLFRVTTLIGSFAIGSVSKIGDAEVPASPGEAKAIPATPPFSPPSTSSYLQYGVALNAEVAVGGPLCEIDFRCVLGSGAGITGRLGIKSRGPLYVGGAYALSKHDASRLYRLAILQQIRVETRYYVSAPFLAQPYVAAGLGVCGYGNEWSVSTWGPLLFLGGGVEAQVQGGPLLGFAVGFRPLYLRSFENPAGGADHPAGVSSMLSFELVVENRDRR